MQALLRIAPVVQAALWVEVIEVRPSCVTTSSYLHLVIAFNYFRIFFVAGVEIQSFSFLKTSLMEPPPFRIRFLFLVFLLLGLLQCI